MLIIWRIRSAARRASISALVQTINGSWDKSSKRAGKCQGSQRLM
jgi:hypothetical protein